MLAMSRKDTHRKFNTVHLNLAARFTISLLCLLFLPMKLYASFIEATIGTAVVNDASATYHNPAALTLLKNPQLVALGSVANFRSQFSGQFTQTTTGRTLGGSSTSQTHYFLPSLYFAIPSIRNFTFGLGITYNDFNRSLDDGSLLRYVQPGNRIRDIDFVPAFGVKLNKMIAIGFGLDLSHVNILLQPVTGFPQLNIPDNVSRDVGSATSWGMHAGILLHPSASTLIGFNYRSVVTYQVAGSSSVPGNPPISSNNYHFKIWTPARSVLTISQKVGKSLGFIGTMQYIQWNIFNNINIFNVANSIGFTPVILPNVKIPYHFHNAWIFTVGGQYNVIPQWIIRVALSYVESAANPHYQIADGDNIILGASTGYDINKNFSLDFGYSHAFIKSQNINLATIRNNVNGVTNGSRDAISLKLTVNFV